MPMELVISTGTPRCLAQASWCFLAFLASNGATAGGGGLSVHLDLHLVAPLDRDALGIELELIVAALRRPSRTCRA